MFVCVCVCVCVCVYVLGEGGGGVRVGNKRVALNVLGELLF